jgi:hypothetical protein
VQTSVAEETTFNDAGSCVDITTHSSCDEQVLCPRLDMVPAMVPAKDETNRR